MNIKRNRQNSGSARFSTDVMAWIDELEKDAWNVIIDELVWHLREDRMPVAIRRHSVPKSGIEFCFELAQPAFFSIERNVLGKHWDEAVTVIRQYSELSALKTYDV